MPKSKSPANVLQVPYEGYVDDVPCKVKIHFTYDGIPSLLTLDKDSELWRKDFKETSRNIRVALKLMLNHSHGTRIHLHNLQSVHASLNPNGNKPEL